MDKVISLRKVPARVHRRLKSRAALAGMPLSKHLLNELHLIAEQPTLEEMRARLRGRSRTNPSPPPADMIRAIRDGIV